MNTQLRFDEIINWFETLSPQSLAQIDQIYAEQAHFVDPFNDVNHCKAIRAIYQHMFDTLHQPRFHVTRKIIDGHSACLVWQFTFGLRGQHYAVQGSTVFELNAHGLITVHRDYWDPAHELYEKIPLLGRLMKWLRNTIATPH